MHDAATRVLRQNAFRKQTDDVVALDECASLIEQEAAVEVAVPRDTHVRAMLEHRVTRNILVFQQHRVRDPVRKRPIRFVMHLDEFERQVCLERIGRDARAPVARIDDQLQRLEVLRIDVRHHVVDVLGQDVDFGPLSAICQHPIVTLGQHADVV